MKCKSGINNYKIPAYSQIQSVLITGQQKHNVYALRLNQIGIEEFIKRPITESSHPKIFAITDDKIYFWPTPHKPLKIIIRYFPPLKEF